MAQARGWMISAATAAIMTTVLPLATGDPLSLQSPPVSDSSPPEGQLAVYVFPSGPFSPNADGCRDQAWIYVQFFWPSGGSQHYWSISIEGPPGTVFSVSGDTPVPYYAFFWEGIDLAGKTVVDGFYHVQAFAQMRGPGGLLTHQAEGALIVDTAPPSIVAMFPSPQEVSVPIGDDEVKVGYTTTTSREVWAMFGEDVVSWRAWLLVVPEAGTSAEGYSYYDWSTRRVVFRTWQTMLGKYRAYAHGEDWACNAVDREWSFLAATYSPYL